MNDQRNLSRRRVTSSNKCGCCVNKHPPKYILRGSVGSRSTTLTRTSILHSAVGYANTYTNQPKTRLQDITDWTVLKIEWYFDPEIHIIYCQWLANTLIRTLITHSFVRKRVKRYNLFTNRSNPSLAQINYTCI